MGNGEALFLKEGVMQLEAMGLGFCCSVEGFQRSEIPSQTSLQANCNGPHGDEEGLSQGPEIIKVYYILNTTLTTFIK